jgi:hypothetical protein
MGEHWRKSTNNREGSQCRNYDAGLGTIFNRCKVETLQLLFSLTRQQNIKIKCAV